MFILIVAGGYAEKSNPLLGIFELDQALALQKYGHKIILASIDLRSIRRKRKLGFGHLYHKGIEVYNFSFPLGRVPKRILLWVGRLGIKKLYSKIFQVHGSPDILHAHFTVIAAITATLKKKYDIPFVITEHSSQINKDRISKSAIYFGNNSYKYADKVIAVSSTLAHRIRQHIDIECVVIPNIVDTEIFKITKDKKDKFVFISVGSLVYGKGFDILIDGFSQAQFDENVFLYIVGDGWYKNDLEKQIHKLNLEKQVSLLGALSRQQIQDVFSISSVFILTSRSETFGVAYIEAMTAGLPVIATQCGGPEDFVNDGNGLLVNVNDIEDTTTAMKYMHQNLGKYDRVWISNEIKRKYAPETIVQQLTEVYQSI